MRRYRTVPEDAITYYRCDQLWATMTGEQAFTYIIPFAPVWGKEVGIMNVKRISRQLSPCPRKNVCYVVDKTCN